MCGQSSPVRTQTRWCKPGSERKCRMPVACTLGRSLPNDTGDLYVHCVLDSGNWLESVFSRMLARAAADAREELHTSGRTCAEVARVGPPSFVILLRSMSCRNS